MLNNTCADNHDLTAHAQSTAGFLFALAFVTAGVAIGWHFYKSKLPVYSYVSETEPEAILLQTIESGNANLLPTITPDSSDTETT